MGAGARAQGGGLTVKSTRRLLVLVILFGLQTVVHAADDEPKVISGMSIIGNDEVPKALFIVPWKSSEIGSDTGLTSGLLDDSMRPVDRDVFMREIDFYEIRHAE